MSPLSVGIFCEGTDWMILQALLCRILARDPSEISLSKRLTRGGSFANMVNSLPAVLSQFYRACVSLVVVCTDNDGKLDLTQANAPPEDPNHPRHARHSPERNDKCRHCILEQEVAKGRVIFNYLPSEDGAHWPIVITVPVETIESWLITARALVAPGAKIFRGEDLPGGERLKREFYEKPFVTTPDVKSKALPVVNNPALNLDDLAAYSPSFRLFLDSLRSLYPSRS